MLFAQSASAGIAGSISAQQSKSDLSEPLNYRLIVKMRAGVPSAFATQASGAGVSPTAQFAASIASARTGIQITALRDMSGDAVVLQTPNSMPESQLEKRAREIASDPAVLHAQVDYRKFPLLTPNDPSYASQTHYQSRSSSNWWGINAPSAWDITTGNPSVKIAVLDTGIVSHADLNANVLPGYDMVSDVSVANDGNLRDADASDPGDWVTTAESTSGPLQGCRVTNSSWHGSHVAGTISAVSNNASGVAGVNWSAKIVPVRVLGKCGGFTSDILDGVRWAAGLAVVGVPNNPNPARVTNMSLGGCGACSTLEEQAYADATNAGALVVVAAGNSNRNLATATPASCPSVAAVVSLDQNGARSAFSNFGSGAFIAAPGNGVLSTINSGTTVPVAGGDIISQYSGTSMAAPHIAGVAALMLAVDPTLTVARLRALLAASSAPFVTLSSGIACYGNTCGAGMLDAGLAVTLANSPPVSRVAWVTKSARGLEGATIQLMVERFGPASGAASVSYATTPGSATVGVDFAAASGTLSWAAGETGRKVISISLLGDADTSEVVENFVVALSNPIGLSIYGSAVVTVEIENLNPCVDVAIGASYGIPVGALGSLAATDCNGSPRGSAYYSDVYSVALSAGDLLSVQLSGFTSTTPAQHFDSFLYLTGPSGNVVALNDDAAGSAGVYSSLIQNYRALASGTYRIYATSFFQLSVGDAYQVIVLRNRSCNLDMNGDGVAVAGVEGLIFMRSLMGIQSPALLNGTGITQAQWDTIRPVINSACGLSLNP
jgi:serine protease